MPKIKILSVNMCHECKAANWASALKPLNADVIFLQEIDRYNIAELAARLSMLILNINHFKGIAVLIRNTIKIIDNSHVKFHGLVLYLAGIHLHDIPSVPHHIEQIPYKSSQIIPVNTPMSKILTMCKMRLPEVRQAVAQSGKFPAIIAGDFNEPSHLDIKLNLPVSQFMQKNKFIDTYRVINKDAGFTWPAAGFYPKEPKQRIDFIYARGGFKSVSSRTIEMTSDHKVLLSILQF